MGNKIDNSKSIKICLIGGDEQIINDLFPYSMSVEEKVDYKKRNYHKNIEAKNYISEKSEFYSIYWESYIFPKITNDNGEKTIKTIFHEIFEIPDDKENNEKNEKKVEKKILNNNVIIIFGSKNADILLKCTYLLSRVYLPQIAVITNKNIEGIQDNRFLTILRHNDNKKILKEKIYNYLWERECYFNQRGLLINQFSPENAIPSKDLPNSSLNIMLTGLSRSGKSTLVNILSKKMVSLETPEFKSVTTDINEYIIYRDVGEKDKEEIIKIKFIDTPGLIFDPKDKKNNKVKDVIDSIEKKIKEYEDTNESIHIIYFFMPDKPNLEQIKIFFEYLNKLNNDRINNNFPRLPILFVFNCEPSGTNKDALKLFLEENKYNNLYEKGEEEKKDRENITLLQKLELLKSKKNQKIIEDNIIELELLKVKTEDIDFNEVILGNGLSKLLRATKYFIQRRNPFYKEDFDQLKFFIKKFKNYNLIQQKNFEELKFKCKDLIIKISLENNLLSKLKNEEEIIKRAKKEANNTIYITSTLGFMIGMIPIPYLDIPILYSVHYGMIAKIGNCFNVSYSEIPNSIFFKLIFGLGADVQSSAKIVGNGVASATGESFGKELIYDIGEEQVVDWAKNGLHVVKSGGNVNVGKVAENLIIKNESKFKSFLTYIYNLFPSFNKSVKNGIEAGGQQLGKKLENVLIDNTKNLSQDFIIQASENIGQNFGEKLVGNASGHLKTLTPKIIPVIGSLIGGVLDSYSTYRVGKNSITYFEDYIKKTMCCEYIVKRKEEYEKILNSLETIANDFDTQQKFKINIIN